MHLDITAAIRFGGRFYRLIDKLYAGADRHVLKQEFDVIVAQTYAAVAYAQADTEVSVGAVDGVQTTDIQRVQAHRVIRTSRYDGRQRVAGGSVFRMHLGGRRPGRAGLLTFDFSSPVDRRIFTQLADADRQNDDGVGAFRVVVQTHFRAVDNDPFMHRIRQDQLLRNVQYATAFRQIGVHPRVGFQHVG